MNKNALVTIYWHLIKYFFMMEAVTWLTHKFVMHGFLWYLHEDHHQKQPGFFEKNDAFFVIFAIPSFSPFFSVPSRIYFGYKPLVLASWPMALLISWCMMLSSINVSNGFPGPTIPTFAPSAGPTKCTTGTLISTKANHLVCYTSIKILG